MVNAFNIFPTLMNLRKGVGGVKHHTHTLNTSSSAEWFLLKLNMEHWQYTLNMSAKFHLCVASKY